MKALFICSRNRLRSPTGEYVAKTIGIDSDSAGLAPDAEQVLEPYQIEWCDIIFVMESQHKSKLTKKYSHLLKNKKIILLNIRDDYDYMQPELVEIFQHKLPQFFSNIEYKKQTQLTSIKNKI